MTHTIAATALGDLEGREENGVVVFRGVRYAHAPTGERRFRAPEPIGPWSGLCAAGTDGPVAPQGPSRLRAVMGDFTRPMDEDCLTLTIWTPAADAKARPVLVWLHGGAWQSGAGSLDWYDGATLAREGDIVVVGVNYRLGALGYLHHPAIGERNPGSLDQIAALRFVREHIAAFGGDRARVTVAGQSAGASSIGRLILDVDARSLFRAAILQSGSFGRPPLDDAEATATASAFMRLLDIDPQAADAPARLRSTPVPALLQAQSLLARQRARFGETNPPFMPVLAEPMGLAQLQSEIAARAGGLPVLIGATREEVHAFYGADPAMHDPPEAMVAGRFAELGADRAAWQARRPAGSAMDLLADLASERTFIGPAWDLAATLVAAGSDVFAYRFDWAPSASPFRACHCIELPFVFGTFAAWDAPMLRGGEPAAMMALSARMRRSWIGFVRDLTPAGDGLSWPSWSATARPLMHWGDVIELGSAGRQR
ncbi:MAG: carboxylesterase/lipase family protein [Rhodospirillales bacterium]|nr:carboxylesterase/lipase family protein [Rhodospirillales bacterium]